jgi:XTP/dITP diphosphohydrolase
MELIIASQNSHKVAELREILKELFPSLSIRSLFDFQKFTQQDAVYGSFEESAAAKALHAAKTLNAICLADDSGIVIPALSQHGGSLRRYENNQSLITARTKKLLEELQGLNELQRSAYLECSLALATPQKLERVVSQRIEGLIAEKESGKLTFEFDTIFIKYDYNKTLGELPQSIRNRISHRRKALEKLIPTLDRLIRTSA